MFDFRYHVASLAAVFLALVIGILVGVGVSGRGLVDKSERRQFQKQIAILQSDLESAQARARGLDQQQRATEGFIQAAYPALMYGRLANKRVVVLVVGRDDGSTGSSVEQALRDASALDVIRYRAIRVPVDAAALDAPLASHKQLAGLAGDDRLGRLGRELALELVKGGKAPLWEALSGELIDERRGTSSMPADGAVVIRTVPPQAGATARLLAGLYAGLASSGVPAVGVERSNTAQSAVPAFSRADLSTVDDVDTPLGKLALVLLLEGVDTGHFGVGKQTAPDGTLPTIVPLQPASLGG